MKLPKFRKRASKDLAKSEAKEKEKEKIPKPSKEEFSKKEEKKAKEILKKEAALKAEEELDENTTTEEVALTAEQLPTIVKDGKGTTIFILKTTTEKLLYQIIQQQDAIIQQNQHMIGLSEKE